MSDDIQGTLPDAVSGDAGNDSFNLNDVRGAFENAVDSIEIGDDGSLDMKVRAPEAQMPEAPAQAPQPEAVPADAPVLEETAPEQTDTLTADDLLAEIENWEDRYKNLQGAFTKATQDNKSMAERLARLEGRMEAQAPPAPEQDDVDFYGDPQAVQQYISKQVEKQTQTVLRDTLGNEMGEMIADWKIGREITQAIASHPDFADYVPQMEHLFRTVESDLSVEEAYQLAKSFGSKAQPEPQPQPQPQPQGTPAPETQQSATPSPQELAQRSQALRTEQGHTNDAGFERDRVIASPKDAILAALEDTYGS